MSGEALLVLNAGSSSLKVSLYAAPEGHADPALLYRGQVTDIGGSPRFRAADAEGRVVSDSNLAGAEASHATALEAVLDWIAARSEGLTLTAAGHRVVHGGAGHDRPVRISEAVRRELGELVPLAPLHQPHNLAAVDALWRLHPELPQVACFDTAFHRTQPELAQQFALPRWLADEGVKRYGFHGLSYAYIASVLPDYAGDRAEGRIVVAHLGHGASLCAMRARRSVATTMGFTALDGLPMGTRCGDLDPGVILYMLDQKGMSADAVADTLYHQSGLYGLSGESDDMADLLASDARGARDAVALFCYRAGRELGSLAAALGGLDGLVFTAGIGEHAAEVRRRICCQARWLGLELDHDANRAHAQVISTSDSPVAAYVIPTDEALVIARDTWALHR